MYHLRLSGVTFVRQVTHVLAMCHMCVPCVTCGCHMLQEGKELDLTINMLEYEASREVVIQKAIKRCFHIFRRQESHALVVETTADLGRRLITLRFVSALTELQ